MTPPSVVSSKTSVSKPIESAPNSLRSFSLKGMAQSMHAKSTSSTTPSAKNEETIVIDPSWNSKFTQEELTKCWLLYAEKNRVTNPRLYSIFVNHSPVLQPDGKIILHVKNKTQESELLSEKSVFMPYFKKALQNANFELFIEIVMVEDDDTQKAYTSADKFKLMLEKNPALIKLKQQFSLDLD